MKIYFILIFSIFPFLANSQAVNDTLPPVEYFIITEAFTQGPDTVYNLKKEFVDRLTGVFFVPTNDSTLIISIDHGGKDGVYLIGYAKEVPDPGLFEVKRPDSKFYLWSYDNMTSKSFKKHMFVNSIFHVVTRILEEVIITLYFLFSIISLCFSLMGKRGSRKIARFVKQLNFMVLEGWFFISCILFKQVVNLIRRNT